MAVLSSSDLNEMRNFLQSIWTTIIDFDKPTINAGFQAMEDEYERPVSLDRPGFRLAGAADVQAAVSPKVFNNPELKNIERSYLKVKVKL